MKLKDFFNWGLIAAMIMYVLYQKGIIFANFKSVTPQEAATFYHDNNTTLLDVRTPEELKKEGMIAGAILIPVQVLEKNLSALAPYKDTKILVYCRTGNRSVTASRILSRAGFTPYNLDGGINAWKKAKLAIQR